MMLKQRTGRLFEDFHLGEVIRHGTHRTLSDADASLYIALTGSRYAAYCADSSAKLLGFQRRPIDNMLLFNVAFGKTVPDISLNAIANLGYAELRFTEPVFAGDTLHCESVVIGLKENSNKQSGIVYVRSTCFNQKDQMVLTWTRWVMLPKRKPQARVKETFTPSLLSMVGAEQIHIPAKIQDQDAVDEWCEITGSNEIWDSYHKGERINHPLGMTLGDSDHMTATRLYQNNSRPHFDAIAMQNSPMGQRLVYGGHIISICQALAYDGLENTLAVASINGGQHLAPTFAGDTLYTFTEVLDKWKLPGRNDVGALRLRMIGLKNTPAEQVKQAHDGKNWHASSVLVLDYTVLMPKKHSKSTLHFAA